ncbi:MAG: hypothetical protein GY809_25500 [Planctomycetes bacterium]|nr:hypothetical protein [Planctomycetota bacterium]
MEEELIIQLAGVESKRETVERTLATASQFRHLYLEHQALEPKIRRDRDTLSAERIELQRLITELDGPDQCLGLPEVYKNKVPIHPAASRR